MRMLSIREVCHKTGISRATIYRLEKAGDFPAKVKVTPYRSAWPEASVDTWLTARGAPAPDTLPKGAMPWYPSAFLGATRGWPCCARLLYRELLEAQWDMGSLPDSEPELRKIAGVDEGCWSRGWVYVKRKFRPGRDGRLRNSRLEQHRAKP
jgi:prophage regulatory protein